MSFFYFYFLVFFNCYHFSVGLHFSAQPLERAETAGIVTDTETMKTQCKSMQEIYIKIFKMRRYSCEG